mgnify:CR=1 FL=1
MLVLTRKREQSIIIGDNVEVMVLGVSGDKVRLGITAPREVEVFRKEVIRLQMTQRLPTKPTKPEVSPEGSSAHEERERFEHRDRHHGDRGSEADRQNAEADLALLLASGDPPLARPVGCAVTKLFAPTLLQHLLLLEG